MKMFLTFTKRFLGHRQLGAAATEYGLFIGLIAILLLGTLSSVGGNIAALFDQVNQKIALSDSAETPPDLPPPNTAPTISAPASLSATGGAGSFSVTLSDAENAPSDLTVTLTDGSGLVTSWSSTGTDSPRTITYNAAFTEGTATLTLTVTDPQGATGTTTTALTITKPPADNCQDLYTLGWRSDGTYSLDPDGDGIYADFTCLMTAQGGGWTEITSVSETQTGAAHVAIPDIGLDYSQLYFVSGSSQYVNLDYSGSSWRAYGFPKDRMVFAFSGTKYVANYSTYHNCTSSILSHKITTTDLAYFSNSQCKHNGSTLSNGCPSQLILSAPSKISYITDIQSADSCHVSNNRAVWNFTLYGR